MCLYPKLILNPKYKANKKRPVPPILTDERARYVPIGCGNCIECRRQLANGWRTRLLNEIKRHRHKYFVTLTFSDESLRKLQAELKTSECNAVAGMAVRRFLERYRKHNKHSLRHWLITELGHENTERIHLHGVIFSEELFNNEILESYWQYGKADTGQYVNERTINYIVKYCTKVDNDHKGYKPQIFCSSGIGANYVTKQTIRYHTEERDYYVLNNGAKIGLPIYYRNKFFNDETREKLWLKLLDKSERYINGIRLKVENYDDLKKYYSILTTQQHLNISLGYGDGSEEWAKRDYNTKLRDILKKNEKK